MNAGKQLIWENTYTTLKNYFLTKKKVVHCPLLLGGILPQLKI
jgi:hypothetical protein